MRLVLSLLLAVFGVLTVWRRLPPWADFWSHASIGRWMVEHGQVASSTFELWSADVPWVYHHWLTEIIFYGMALLGPQATMAITTVLALIPFAIVWFRGGPWMAVPIVIGLQALAIPLQTRPELFSVIGMTILLTTRLRWGLIPLFVLWANLHGGVAIGILLLCASLRFRAAIVAFLACCINPYGVFYWKALFPVGSYIFSTLLEWKPVWATPAVPDGMLEGIGILVVMAVFLCRKKEHFLWLLLLGGMAMLARRNLWPLTICCLVIASQTPLSFGLMRGPIYSSIAIWLMLAILPMPARQAAGTERMDNGIVAWMKDNNPSGRIMSDYTTASYLHWHRIGPLYIDTMNAYPDQLLKDYFDIIRVTERGIWLLNDIDVVILGTERGDAESRAKLASYLDRHWHRVYCGKDGVIWMRDGRGEVADTDFSFLERWGNPDDLVVKGIEQ